MDNKDQALGNIPGGTSTVMESVLAKATEYAATKGL